MKRIGVLGGTFNPVHNGHLALAAAAKKEFALDKIIFMPAGVPPHKETREIEEKKDRYRMVKLAIKRHPDYSVSRIEMDREGFSYAVDTFNILKKSFKGKVKLFYIMGLDSINEILSWKKPLELFKLCEFIVGTRPGTRIRTFRRLVKFPPLEKEVDKIHIVELKEDISSSDIRRRISEGRSAARLAPKAVLNYIRRNNLYRDHPTG